MLFVFATLCARLINKQDIEGALEDFELLKELELEALVNKHECPTKIVSVSACANCMVGSDCMICASFRANIELPRSCVPIRISPGLLSAANCYRALIDYCVLVLLMPAAHRSAKTQTTTRNRARRQRTTTRARSMRKMRA